MAAPEVSGGETPRNKVVYAGETLIDLSEDTVTPAALKSGVTAHDASGAKITGTLDTTPPEESDINFWDYDGTLLYAWTLAELATKTELPPLPSHDGLICQGWNWTLQDIKDAGRELDIGALYITDDGKTRLYVDVDTETWDDFVLNYWQSNINTTTVDWGDGTTPETKDASSWIEHRHVYAASGSYVITMSVKDGKKMWLGHDGRMLIANGDTDSGRCSMLRKVEVGARVTGTDPQCFRNCCRLESVSLPQATKIYTPRAFEQCTQLRVFIAADMDEVWQSFYRCSNLRAIATPKGTTQKNNYAIANTAVRQVNFDMIDAYTAEALERVHIKAVNGQVGDFSSCRALLEVTIPADATTFVAAAFSGDNALRRVTCLGDIASIPAQVFQRCYPLRFVDFTRCTAVPTLANVNAFDSTHPQLEIRVPASLADAWKAATNWSSLADHIVGV
jgi:hypothetical protein